MSTRMLQRRGLASEWAATNPILGEGEIGFIKDTGEIRIGDGVTPFETLTSPYVTKAGAVTSVAGRAGAVALTAADVAPGTFPAGVYNFAGAASVVSGDGTVAAALRINSSANGGKTLDFQSVGLSRWKVQIIGNETGSNAGSDYTIKRYSDAGALIDTPFSISRLDAAAFFTGPSLMLDDGSNARRIRFTSDATNSYIQTDKPVRITAPLSGTARQIFDTSGDISSHGTFAGFSMYERTTDANFFTWYNSGSTLRLYSSATGFNKLSFDANGNILGDAANAVSIGWINDPALTGTALQTNPSGANNGALVAVGRSSGNKVFVVRGASGQASDLMQWQTNTATSLAEIDSGGGAHFPAAFIGARVSYGTLTVTPGSTSIVGEVIRGLAGQTADLLSLQSSDAITHLSLRANGDIISNGSLTLNGQTQGIEHGAQGISNSPYFDWHSSATANDYDVRMQAVGGTTLSGHGQLNIMARLVQIQGDGSTSNFAVSADGSNGRGPEIALWDTKAGQVTPNKFIRSMGGILQFLNHAYTLPIMQVDDSGNFVANNSVTAPYLVPSGMAGAQAGARYVGATASGAPTTGTFAVGDVVIDRTGKIWICTTAGSPGTWTQAGGSGGGSSGVTVKTATPYVGWSSTLSLSGSNPPNSSAYWAQIGNSVTIVCGASGIIELDYVFLGYSGNTGNYFTYITAAQNANDAYSAYGGTTVGGVSSQYTVGSGQPVNIKGKRVVSGLTPGTSYTFAVYGAASANGAIQYSSSSGNVPYPHNELTATTY